MSIRFVPFSATYDRAELYGKISDGLLYLSTCLSVVLSYCSTHALYQNAQQTLVAFNCVFIVLIFVTDISSNYVFTKAEMKRRLDFLDNAFGSKLSGVNSKEYFTNEHLSPGLYKLSVNCFENCHHSQTIIGKMLPVMIIRNLAIVLIFVFSACMGKVDIVRLLFELSLPVFLLQKLIKAGLYSARMSSIHDRFRSMFNDLMKHDFSDKTAEAMRLILDYETVLAWASTPLSSKIFWKHKEKLAEDWERLKTEYNIK